MLFGTGDIVLYYDFNEYNLIEKTFTDVSCIYEWNKQDILLQKAISGFVWKVFKGYYHTFKLTIDNPTTNDLELIRLLCLSDGKGRITPHNDNMENTYVVNSVSKPYYVSDINGILSVTITLTTKNYAELAEV